MSEKENNLIAHLEALRRVLLRCVVAVAILYPLSFWLSPEIINLLVRWCLPENMSKLHYFAPMEVFWVQLKLALIIALIMSYPFNAVQIWKFLLPALYADERKALRWWIIFSSLLFLCGVAFCIGLILPMLMNFSGGFATPELQPLLGLANFLQLAGWLMLAFGVMFQSPIVVLLLVRFSVISLDALREKRPYIMTGILILSAILTPPDVVSQILLSVPTWILFELGLLLAKRVQPINQAPV